jgi:hypothetical protein
MTSFRPSFNPSFKNILHGLLLLLGKSLLNLPKKCLKKVEKTFRLIIHLISLIDREIIHHEFMLGFNLLQIIIKHFQLFASGSQDYFELLHKVVERLLRSSDLSEC